MATDLAPITARQNQEARLVEAVRTLFDDGGLRDFSIDQLARRVGINKATIYRHVASKDELVLLALGTYQAELKALYDEVDSAAPPVDQLMEISTRYLGFCRRYPAYLDCLLGLMARPYDELARTVSPGVLVRVFTEVGEVNSRVAAVLVAGRDQGVFAFTHDPDVAVHVLYSATVGVLQLLRMGVGVRLRAQDAYPDVFPLHKDEVNAVLADVVAKAIGITATS